MTNEEAKEILEEVKDLDDSMYQYISAYEEALDMAIKALEQEPKTGYWIRITNGAMREKYICSKCGRQIEDYGIEGLLPVKYPYCHCGAKMVEPQESEVK